MARWTTRDQNNCGHGGNLRNITRLSHDYWQGSYGIYYHTRQMLTTVYSTLVSTVFSGKGQPIRGEKALFSRFWLVEIWDPSPKIPCSILLLRINLLPHGRKREVSQICFNSSWDASSMLMGQLHVLIGLINRCHVSTNLWPLPMNWQIRSFANTIKPSLNQ